MAGAEPASPAPTPILVTSSERYPVAAPQRAVIALQKAMTPAIKLRRLPVSAIRASGKPVIAKAMAKAKPLRNPKLGVGKAELFLDGLHQDRHELPVDEVQSRDQDHHEKDVAPIGIGHRSAAQRRARRTVDFHVAFSPHRLITHTNYWRQVLRFCEKVSSSAPWRADLEAGVRGGGSACAAMGSEIPAG
ncbi:MAG: hypothetical protein WDM79_19420 [Terricaulis sp.]